MDSMWQSSNFYLRVSSEKENEDSKSLLNRSPTRIESRRSCFITLSLLIVSVVVNILLYWSGFQQCNVQLPKKLHPSGPTSLIDEQIPNAWETVNFNGSLAKETIYRKPASPEVDQAWEDLGVKVRFIGVPTVHAEQYGLHPWQVKLDAEEGGGVLANVEVFHQLHCLNVLRKGSHWDFNYYWKLEHEENPNGVFASPEDIIRIHFSHCLDMIRQRIMCTADTGLFGQVWLQDHHSPTIDFNTRHRCRNFRDVQKWMDENAVNGGHEMVKVKYQEGDVVVDEMP